MNLGYCYDDVCLEPSYFNGYSRRDLSTSIKFGNKNFNLPVIPANMACCMSPFIAKKLSKKDFFYILDRFESDYYYEVYNWLSNKELSYYSISVGVLNADIELIEKISREGISLEYLTIDIAHGHSKGLKKILKLAKEILPDTFVIAGNVGSPEATRDLFSWGADCVKVGIGPGSVCTTKLKTGFHTPMYSTVNRCAVVKKEFEGKYIIADGGIKYNGDIAKAIHAGADMVMVGKLFAECVDSDSRVIDTETGNKVYYGSASSSNKNHSRNIEGKEVVLSCNGMTYLEKMEEIKQDLQSSISYAGGKSIYDIRKANLIYTK